MRQSIRNIFDRKDELSRLEDRLSRLEERLEAKDNEIEKLHRRIERMTVEKPNYDLVRVDNVGLFMPTNDNLYDRVVPDDAKGFDRTAHRELMRAGAPPRHELEHDVKKLLYLYLDILNERNVQTYFLDFGAWVGDVAIRLARFAALRQYRFDAVCYDPSFAGCLIPFNAALNDVSDRVTYQSVGLSRHGGPHLFHQIRGNSDASRLDLTITDLPEMEFESYPIWTVTGAACFAEVPEGAHLMAKFDVEGVDAEIIMDNLDELNDATLMIELAVGQGQYKTIDTAAYLRTLDKTHSLFDLVYLQQPTSAALIDKDHIEDFIADIPKRAYGFTDILAVPRSLPAHDDLATALTNLPPQEPSYVMG